jgi:DNA-binding MarR family transcriptional regulator
MPPGARKEDLIGKLVQEFRISGNQDKAFDNVAAALLGLNETDLHCVNIIENGGGISAGGLAKEAGLTTGAVTGVIDRLERAGYARRVPDPGDRRRVRVEVTPRFYERSAEIWAPLRADWGTELAKRFSAAELEAAIEFLRATNELAGRHLERVTELSRSGKRR